MIVPKPLLARQSTACFVVGDVALPAEVQDSVDAIEGVVSCDASQTTIDSVPDVSSGGVTFSSINFDDSSSTPLEFALDTFATADPLASTDLDLFQNELNTYLATEAGIRSVDGSLEIKVPKFFLAFQIARIQTAQGVDITDPGSTVEHLLGKVQSNGAGESQDLLDEVAALATELS